MIDGLYQLLAKFGFSEPLHPPITHMPIGLAVGALIFFLVAIIFKRKTLELTARHASILALIFAFPTILLGVFDWIHFYHAALITPIKIKMVLAAIVLVVLGAGIILGSEVKLRSVWMTSIYALAFICVIGLGYFGAGLIYGRGVEQQSAAPLSKEESSGQAVFAENCISCHANGGNAVNPKYPLKSTVLLDDKNAFIAFIRDPQAVVGAQSQMPSFPEDAISRDKAEGLFAYIKAMVSTTWK